MPSTMFGLFMSRCFAVITMALHLVLGFVHNTYAQQDTRIALLLPISIPSPINNVSKANHAMAELLTGALQATADLKKHGSIRLYVYDTHKNVDTLAHILTYPELAEMDLLLGPVYMSGSKELAAFAASKSIPLVNPLANQVHWDVPNTFAYLAEPDYTEMAEAVLNLQEGGAGRKAICFYGTYPKDSALANAFDKLATERGLTVLPSKKVAKNSAANLPKFIKDAGLDSTSIVFVPNNEPLVRQQLLPALEVNRCRALLVTYGEWLEEADVALEKFERNRILFLYPGYVNLHNPELKAWRQSLTDLGGLPPTEITCKGYDLVYTLGKALMNAKPEARKNFLKEYSPIQSNFSQGFDFADGQSNAKVAIYSIKNGKLVPH